jgi:hypothetical protein
MKIFLGLLAIVALLLLDILWLVNGGKDLRGWTPENRSDPATIVQPSRPGGVAFTLGECLPGSIRPWEPPTQEEYSGTATLTVLACRSRASAMPFIAAYGAVVAVALVVLIAARRRKRTAA